MQIRSALRRGISLFLIFIVGIAPAVAHAKNKAREVPPEIPAEVPVREVSEEIERIIPLRSKGVLQITNNRGEILITGWSQDKIRIKAIRHTQAATDEEARRLLAAADIRDRVIDGGVEISAEYGKGLTLEERLRERATPRTRLDMVILAPASLQLQIWSTTGKVHVKNWKESIEVRSSSGEISISEIDADNVSVLCPSCPIRLENVKGSVRCQGESGGVELRNVAGSQIFVESDSASLKASEIRGEQLYVSKTGSIELKRVDGRIEFQAQSGAVSVDQGQGFLSGRTTSGDITARMTRWRFEDKAIIESHLGDVNLELPFNFSAELDAHSAAGQLVVELPLTRRPGDKRMTVESRSRRVGVVGDGGELLKVFSEKGNVRIARTAR